VAQVSSAKAYTSRDQWEVSRMIREVTGSSFEMSANERAHLKSKSFIEYDEMCLLDHDGDPTGVRAVQDHKRQHSCPLKKLADNNQKRKTKIDNMHKRLETIFYRLGCPVSEDALASYGRSSFKAQFESERYSTLSETSKFAKSARATKETAQKALDVNAVPYGQFALQVDLFDELCQSGSVQRAATYRRVVDPSELGCETPWYQKLGYVAGPMILFMTCFAIQSFLLHVATHFYVRYMESGPQSRRESEGMLFDIGAEFVAGYVGTTAATTKASTDGAVSDSEGRIKIPLAALDASGIIPCVLCAMSFTRSLWQGYFHIGLWTKAFLVASIAAVLKGVFDAVTVLPDSIGWKACKARLTEEGLDQMRSVHWRHNFFSGLLEALWDEVFGLNGGHRVRYCADMLLSGHTYFACVFALAAYRQISYNTNFFNVTSDSSDAGRRRNHWCNHHGKQIVKWVLVCAVLIEVCLVTAARFHYTVDMLVAIVLVVLLFDSMHVEQLASNWSEGFQWKAKAVTVADGAGNAVNRKVLASHAHEVMDFAKFRCFAQPEEEENFEEGDILEKEGSRPLLLPSSP